MARKNTSMDKNAAKKAAVLGTQKNSKTPVIITVALAAIIAAGAIYVLGGNKEAGPVSATAVAATTSQSEFVYPVSDFDSGEAKFYSYRTPEGLTIRYFILKSSDGVIRAALDACDTCWSAGKGYHQEGDFMVCNNCGLKFASVRVNEVKGGCNPSPLTRTVENGKVTIKVQDLVEEGSRYFEFGRRG